MGTFFATFSKTFSKAAFGRSLDRFLVNFRVQVWPKGTSLAPFGLTFSEHFLGMDSGWPESCQKAVWGAPGGVHLTVAGRGIQEFPGGQVLLNKQNAQRHAGAADLSSATAKTATVPFFSELLLVL